MSGLRYLNSILHSVTDTSLIRVFLASSSEIGSLAALANSPSIDGHDHAIDKRALRAQKKRDFSDFLNSSLAPERSRIPRAGEFSTALSFLDLLDHRCSDDASAIANPSVLHNMNKSLYSRSDSIHPDRLRAFLFCCGTRDTDNSMLARYIRAVALDAYDACDASSVDCGVASTTCSAFLHMR